MSEVDKYASPDVVKMLVANKCDLKDKAKVTYGEGKELADHYNMPFLETSAKISKNVSEAFYTLARKIKQSIVPKKTSTATISPGLLIHKCSGK